MSEEFNGFNFDEKKDRKKMKYLIVERGDLDINNAYALRNKKDLKDYLKGNKEKGFKEIMAVFEIKDLTKELKK